MVSIVALEYAYTQAPKTMKSLLMCFYLGAVAIGNFFVAGVNHFIQIPDAAAIQLPEAIAKLPPDWQKSPRTVMLPGHDGVTGTQDDLIQRLKDGVPEKLEIPGQSAFDEAASVIEKLVAANGGRFPAESEAMKELSRFRDPFGNPIRYQILNSARARLMSDGPDRKAGTMWDTGMIIELPQPEAKKTESWSDKLHPKEPWLERRKTELGIKTESGAASGGDSGFTRTAFSGGQTRMHGAAYFWFFTWLMLGTAVAFIPYALLYKPKTYLQD
jgi:POT family proton-dependent oligopeptide transporter